MAYLSQDQKPVGHYVYEHRTHNGRLFYIGKGKGERAYTKNGRNQYWHNVVNKHGGYCVRIIEDNMTHEDALELEIAAIEFAKFHGVRLVNITNGGEGTNGLKWTEERREKMVAAFANDNYKEKISEASRKKWSNPETRKKIQEAIKKAHNSPEVKAKMAIALKDVFASKEYKDKLSAAQKKSWKSKDRKENVSKKITESWKDESVRKKRIAGLKNGLKTEEDKQRRASSMHTTEAIAKNRESIRKAFENPETRKRQLEATRIAVSTPQAKANHKKAIQEAMKRPEVIAKLANRSKILWEKRIKWAAENQYDGPISKITKKMMESKNDC